MFAAVMASLRETQDMLHRLLETQERSKTLHNCTRPLNEALRLRIRLMMIRRPLALTVLLGVKGRKVVDVLVELVPEHANELRSLVDVGSIACYSTNG
jgi:hypothetical protein